MPCDADTGATPIRGLFVQGHLAADAPAPEATARAAIRASRHGSPALGPYKMQAPIDAPLPAGFAAVKFERLRLIMQALMDGKMDAETARMALHRLKGEADEYARARVDAELFSFQNACEVALLIVRGVP